MKSWGWLRVPLKYVTLWNQDTKLKWNSRFKDEKCEVLKHRDQIVGDQQCIFFLKSKGFRWKLKWDCGDWWFCFGIDFIWFVFGGFGCDTAAVINVLAHRDAAQRALIQQEYRAIYSEELTKRLKSELSGKLEVRFRRLSWFTF